MKVDVFDKVDFDWDKFFQTYEGEKIFAQKPPWLKIISQSCNHKPYYFTVRQNQKVIALLPLFLIEKGIFGNFLISLPGGILSKNNDAIELLLEEVIKLTIKEKLNYLSIKDSYSKIVSNKLIENSQYYHMIIENSNDADLWIRLKHRARSRIIKSDKNNFSTSYCLSNLASIYKILEINYKRLGTPLPSLNFFENIKNELGEDFKLIALIHNNRIIGGSISIIAEKAQNIVWYSCLPDLFHLHANYKLYWETIKKSIEFNTENINLGTSRLRSGNFQFKSQWSAIPKPLYSYYYLNKRNITPDYLSESEDKIWIKLLRDFIKHLPTLFPIN